MGGVLQKRLLSKPGETDPLMAAAARLEDELVNLGRNAAKPKPYRFEIRRIATP